MINCTPENQSESSNTVLPMISTSNRMALRAIWEKQLEVYYDVFQNHPNVSEGDLKYVKIDPRVYFPKIARKSYAIPG